jgi:hypothetical protein
MAVAREDYTRLGEADLARPQAPGRHAGGVVQAGDEGQLGERLEAGGQQQAAGATALLVHLHGKIKSFEAERVAWLAKFEAARLSQTSRAAAVRSLRLLNTDLMDLGRAVSECRVHAWEARLQRMELQRTNKDLEHSQTLGQTQRVQELAGVFDETEVKQTIGLRKGQKPQKVTKFSMTEAPGKAGKNNDLSLRQNKVSESSKRSIGRFEAMTEPEKQVKAMYKTVVIPRDPGLKDHLDDSLENHVNLAVR